MLYFDNFIPAPVPPQDSWQRRFGKGIAAGDGTAWPEKASTNAPTVIVARAGDSDMDRLRWIGTVL
jgi:hypothetical protein